MKILIGFLLVFFCYGVSFANDVVPSQDLKQKLCSAVLIGDADAVRSLLLDYGADANVQDNNGKTALMLAIEKGHTETVKVLLAYGADVNMKDNGGLVALMSLAQKYPDIVSLLKQSVAIPGRDFDREFIDAAEQGNIEAMNDLVFQKGVDVKGSIALIRAVEKGQAESVKYLLDKGADINTKDEAGKTALILAIEYGHPEIAVILAEHGADVNVKDEFDSTSESGYGFPKTALILAVEKGQAEAVEALLAKGADINAKNEFGYTALMWAANKGNTKIVKALLGKGADINVKDKDGLTALSMAIKRENTEIIDLLKRAGAKEEK